MEQFDHDLLHLLSNFVKLIEEELHKLTEFIDKHYKELEDVDKTDKRDFKS